jgi:ABC-type Zn uptake system ZnuABC Zn-binding protein ZnuA
MRVVVSFSILEDIVHEVGGSDVAVTSLVGRDANEHVFEPKPDQVCLLIRAQLFIVNGLGLEGCVTRLIQSAQYRGPVVITTDRIRREGIKALFLENISDRRLMEEIARETGAGLGPPLYSDALSAPDGPAPTYIRMIEHNTAVLQAGMLKN